MSKSISGLSSSKNLKIKKQFSEQEKIVIIEDYLRSGQSKRAIWEKYTKEKEEHGLLLYWMYQYGYLSRKKTEGEKIDTSKQYMKKKIEETQPETISEKTEIQKDIRILELEKSLHESYLKTQAYETMISIAEQEFKISIKKKHNIKP